MHTDLCDKLHKQPPSMKLILSQWGDLSTKKFQPDCVHEESSTGWLGWLARQNNRSPQPYCQALRQYWLDKIRKASSS